MAETSIANRLEKAASQVERAHNRLDNASIEIEELIKRLHRIEEDLGYNAPTEKMLDACEPDSNLTPSSSPRRF